MQFLFRRPLTRSPRALYGLGLIVLIPLTGCGVLTAGGPLDDAATAVTVHDRATFVAGYFEEEARFGDFQMGGAGRDWFVGRIEDSTWVWIQGSGTTGLDEPLGIDTDLGGDDVYVVGHHDGAARIERFDAATGARLGDHTFEECTEFAAVAAGQDAVFAACNNALDQWTAIVTYSPVLTSPRLFLLRDGQGDRSVAAIRALRLDSRGLWLYGDFRTRIEMERFAPSGGDPEIHLVANASWDVFLLRLDPSSLIQGRMLVKSGRQIGSEGYEEAADFALGGGKIFAAVRMADDFSLETGRILPAVCPGAGPEFNFAVLGLDGEFVAGAEDPNAGDGINALLSTLWWRSYGACTAGVSVEALDHSGHNLLLAGTFGDEFPTDTDTLITHGGRDAFAMYLDDVDGKENGAFSGGGEGDEQVFDDVQGGLARSWVVGSYLGDRPTFPLVVYDEESILRGTEEVLPGTSDDEVLVWRMSF